ncbi:Zinc finger A20 and AN1 domain-containing stress-associated protein 4 [Capsicum baccatum]|uniref:Zinc finger A20 and AN1 domain-containing stress-associated protein 4 n=1 Tax=Capsicum baccatum TaxID=33114 RepID=A0A2G2V990_CAPBA|nr:Zinc finger A20 and AN1 domain-containing stress-associated protein 4 [Capsicum baccatum]
MYSQGGVLLIDVMDPMGKYCCRRGMHGNYKVMSWFSEASMVTGASPPQLDLRCDTCGVELDLLTTEIELSKETATSSKDVVHRSSCSDELELGLAGAAVASTDLASQISQVKSKEGLKKCTTCRKHVELMWFSCKSGDLFCAVHHYSDKHNCLFDYRNAGQNAIAKANPIIVAEKLNKI